MNTLSLFDLYGLVQKKDKSAEDELIRRWESKCKRTAVRRGDSPHYRQDLHIMYLNLT